MVRSKDRFWEYVEDLKGRFICNFCQKEFAGGIARVKSHLSRQTGRDIAICEKVPEDVQALAALAICSNKRLKTESPSSVERSEIGSSLSLTDPYPHSSMGLHLATVPAIREKKDKEMVDKMVVDAFLINNIAFDVIQSPSFIAMCKAITDHGSGYTLPSNSTLWAKFILNAKKDVEGYASKVKESWAYSGCTLMLNMWTDMNDHSFMNVIAYSPEGVVFLNSSERSTEGKTEFFLRDILLSVIEEIGSENVVQIITDNTCNYEVAYDLIIERHPHIYKTQCAAHGIKLLLKDVYKEVEWIQTVFDNGKMIMDYMCKNAINLKIMMVHTNGKELQKPCKTKFSSHYMMLRSILELEDTLRLMVTSPEWRSMDNSKSEMAQKVTQIIQSADFWNEGKEVVSVLEPLVIGLRLVDREGSTAVYLYEAMERAREALKYRSRNAPEKYKELCELFDLRRVNILHKIHAVAAFLNPSLMYDGKVRYGQAEVRDGMNYVAENIISSNEITDFATQLLLYNSKSPKLFDTLSLVMMTKVHPRKWWEFNGGEVPLLRKIAIRILSQPCSSSPCERNWSAYEAAQTKKRNELSPDMLENLVYVRMNYMMMSNARKLNMQDTVAINFEKLDEFPEDIGDG